MVDTRSPLYFWVPDFAELIGRPLLMAALFGGLLAGTGLVDSFVGRAEWKILIPTYNVACYVEKDVENISEEGPAQEDCKSEDKADKTESASVAGF